MKLALVIVCAATQAHADNALQARVAAEAEKTWLELEIDPAPPPKLVGLLASERRSTRRTFTLDPRTAVAFELDEWANKDRALGYADVRGQGWRASVRASRDLGWARVDLGAAVGDVDTQFGRGRYLDVGVSLLHRFQLSRWMKAWVGLSFGRRVWQGDPPAGEVDEYQAMFVIGTTFR